MAKKNILDKITISVPRKKMEENPAQWVASLGEKEGRSVKHLVAKAIIEYLNC